MGKSVVGGQLARHAATTGAPTLSASIEMGLDELLDRHMAGVARIPANNLRDGIIPPNDWARIAEATGKLADLPLWILDDAAATVPGIRTAAAKVFNTHPVADGPRGLVVVDYLQIITAAVASGNRVVDIGAISGGLKRLAREFDCAVVALAQLNRGLEARVDKRPTLPDLRESGSIENDADVVIGLYRDDYYDHESKEKGILEMIVLKQRSGPTGTIRTAFNAPWQRIDNMARGSH
jgi:replicative DNA helicase